MRYIFASDNCRLFVTVAICLFYMASPATAQASQDYLLLLDTNSRNFTDPKVLDQVEFLNGSAYNGVVVYLVDPYDTAHHPSFSEFEPPIARMQRASHPAIWPWVLWNRVVGYHYAGDPNPNENVYPVPLRSRAYYERIKGMDLYNEVGALGDFLNLFRYALRSAKQLGSPGIVVEPEAYNSYAAQSISLLATLYGKSEQDIINRLKDIGSSMADIVNEEYPAAVLLFPFTNLPHPVRAQTYVAQGMLDRAKAEHFRFTLVDGGEGIDELGYCRSSLDNGPHSLKAAAENFSAEFAPFLRSYPNLELGGTIAPWADPSQRKGWLLQNPPQVSAGYCGEAGWMTGKDFIPLMHYLLTHYKYVWILATDNAKYSPYRAALLSPHDPEYKTYSDVASSINRVLQEASRP